jgi:ferritin-like metal-binding protein YciE
MALQNGDIKDLDDLFVHTLRDIYYAEKQIAKTLPKMIEKAGEGPLRDAFEHHLEETRDHVKRLEKVFEMHGVEAKAVKCPAIDGIIEEAEDLIGDTATTEVTDAALAAAAQAVEHYEMSRYGTLVTWAQELGRDDCAGVLRETLDEEKEADAKLTQIAEDRLNTRAA